MGLNITRDQYTVQPQGLPGIDKANRLGGRVRSAVLRGVNLVNGKTATWSGTKKFTGRAPDGLVTSLDGSSYLNLGSVGLYAPATAPVTLAFFSRNGTPASVGGTLRITPDSGANTFCAIRGTSASYRLGAGYATGGTLPMYAGAPVAASGVAERTVITCLNGLTSTTSTDFEVWINGTKYTTSGPIAFAAQTAGATYFGWDGADSKYPGSLDELLVIEGALSDAEVAEYFRNPYQMYARPAARVWFGAAAAGGGVTLTMADAMHGHASDAVALTTSAALFVADAAHAHTSDALTLSASGATALTVADAAHAHTADGLVLSSSALLTIQAALHTHASDLVTLSTSGAPALLISDQLHAHTADGVALTVSAWLVVGNAMHAHSSANVVLAEGGADVALDAPLFDRVAAAAAGRLGSPIVVIGNRRIGGSGIGGPAAH